MHGGPILLTGDTLALEPVLLLKPGTHSTLTRLTEQSSTLPGYSVLLVGVEEDRSIVLADLVTLPDVFDGLDNHVVFYVVSDNTGVAGVVEEGEGGVDSCPYEDRLGPLLAGLGDHLELSHLVSVELEQLQEVHEESADEDLVLGEGVARGSGEVSLALQAAQHEHAEHGAVENVSDLPLLVVVDEVVVVLVVAGDVGLLLFLGLAAGLVV